jgi:hypothetical protein
VTWKPPGRVTGGPGRQPHGPVVVVLARHRLYAPCTPSMPLVNVPGWTGARSAGPTG